VRKLTLKSSFVVNDGEGQVEQEEGCLYFELTDTSLVAALKKREEGRERGRETGEEIASDSPVLRRSMSLEGHLGHTHTPLDMNVSCTVQHESGSLRGDANPIALSFSSFPPSLPNPPSTRTLTQHMVGSVHRLAVEIGMMA